jgi:hypothetical protein
MWCSWGEIEQRDLICQDHISCAKDYVVARSESSTTRLVKFAIGAQDATFELMETALRSSVSERAMVSRREVSQYFVAKSTLIATIAASHAT